MSLFGLYSPNIAKMKSNGDIRGLIKVLAHQKQGSDVWHAAAIALDEIGHARVIPVLIPMLKDNDEQLRLIAAQALANYGMPAIDALIAALGDEEKCRHAAAALMVIGAPAFDSLMRALRDKESSLRRAGAAYTLGTMKDTRAVEHLITALTRDENNYVRYNAAHALGEIRDARAMDPLTAALSDEYRVAGGAAGALLKLQPPDPETKKLLDLLDNTHVTTINLDKTSEAVQKLFVMISLHVDIHPQSKEFFIRRGLQLAISSNIKDHSKAFLLLSLWSREDPRVDRAIGSMNIS